MKNKVLLTSIITAAVVLLIGCGAATELVLDDAWDLKSIQMESLITTDLDQYLTVTFDSGSNTATFTTGDLWPGPADLVVADTYTYSIDATDSMITLSKDGDPKHQITYDFDANLQEMVWLNWTAVDVEPNVIIVGSDGLFEQMTFERAE
jgi:hypothetical protein